MSVPRYVRALSLYSGWIIKIALPWLKCFPQSVFIGVLLALSSCTPATKVSQPLVSTHILVSTPTPRVFPTHTATYDPNYFPPEWLLTPTPDPNAFTISAELDSALSKEEITRILFSKWLDHFLSENMSLEWRLSEYTIDSIFIPADQTCAQKLGAFYIAEAVVTAKTVLSAHSTTGNSSDWMVSAGGYIFESETHRTIRFKSAILRQDNKYTLEVIMQTPMCD